MESFREMSKEELQAQEVEVNKKYQEFKDLHLSLNMARGKPAPDQIDHANGMLETMTDYHAKDGLDVRNYGVLDGLPEMKEIFSESSPWTCKEMQCSCTNCGSSEQSVI